jgi:hypothetical protein
VTLITVIVLGPYDPNHGPDPVSNNPIVDATLNVFGVLILVSFFMCCSIICLPDACECYFESCYLWSFFWCDMYVYRYRAI